MWCRFAALAVSLPYSKRIVCVELFQGGLQDGVVEIREDVRHTGLFVTRNSLFSSSRGILCLGCGSRDHALRIFFSPSETIVIMGNAGEDRRRVTGDDGETGDTREEAFLCKRDFIVGESAGSL